MRKLFNLYIIIALFLIVGCALSKPQKTIVLNLAAQNSGFLLAQEKPELAQDILEYTQLLLEMTSGDFTKSVFQVWTANVIDSLKLDPFLQMNFKELIKLVNIEIQLSENQQEIILLTYAVIQNFIMGIEAGQ